MKPSFFTLKRRATVCEGEVVDESVEKKDWIVTDCFYEWMNGLCDTDITI